MNIRSIILNYCFHANTSEDKLRIIAELHKLLLSKIGTKYQTCLTTISPA